MKAIVIAGVVAVIATLIGTRFEISWLLRKQYGQFVRDDGPTTHNVKRGTPTMGGLTIMASVTLAYLLAHLIAWTPISMSGLAVMFLFLGCGVVGFLDDWIKISRERSLGLNAKAKMLGQLLVGLGFAAIALNFPDFRGVRPATTSISLLRDLEVLQMPGALVWLALAFGVIWIVLLTVATSNAVNITDGLDGLVPGSAAMAFGAYTLICLWQFNQWCAISSKAGPHCYEVRNPHDLAIIAIALAGSCFAFLWWNAKPAKIFLGDSGSLSLGGALAGLAICSHTELLLVLIGGLYVVETMSDILQVGYFRATKGKRLFKMAPLHHHFELLGWAEITVVIRFWIIAGLFMATALGLFYAEWVVGQ